MEIGRFTTGKWGKRQRDKYLKQFDEAFKLLTRQSKIGKDASDIKPGYRKYNQGSHIIFYRAGTESRIVVTRILHNNMDVERHL
ncbi:MAG: type II toxin-antitoxin system RelE/ParE family toxin [Gammaproteobacteria bacterium]|nr:type II toxin-antitoxin system RelE/ParE family toxin [Gammaproteobacteria bacterium]